jgi:cytochrome P450
LEAFILALLLYPEVFAKVQAEIDQKTGGERLVDFDDRDSLPYFECVLKEVLRFVLIVRCSSCTSNTHSQRFIP